MPANQDPVHVAIILDGNGRWAEKRGLSRSEGHRAGGEALDRLLGDALKENIGVVSLYAFSTENWKRPKAEIQAIWALMREFFQTRFERCMELGIRVTASGDLSKLPALNRKLIADVVKKSAGNRALVANFCVNYGSYDEILHAAGEVVLERVKSKSTKPVTRAEFEKHLYTHPLPPVDLLVRPGGEKRLSNFLLWQCAYAELYFTDVLWPDFNKKHLKAALNWYRSRPRKFGGLLSQKPERKA